jgi:hypothetical protein
MEVLFVSTIIYPLIERKCTSTMLTALFVKKKKKKKEKSTIIITSPFFKSS